MTRHDTIALLAIASALATATLGPAQARQRHRHHEMLRQAPAPRREPFSFYPEDIEGGVKGNLPFNNQVRKLKDPLNANGAR